MNSKVLASVILAVVLAIDAGAFVALGVGTGGLSTVGPTNSNTEYQFSYALAGSYWGDGMSYHVDMASVNQSGIPMTTSLLAGYSSTPLTFDTVWYSGGDCGHTGQPVFVPSNGGGSGADYGYYMVSFGGATFSGTLDGQQFPPTDTLAISQNASGIVLYCGLTSQSGGNDFNYPNPSSGALTLFQHTLVLTGVYSESTLSIAFHAALTHCDGNTYNPSSGRGADCAAAVSTNACGSQGTGGCVGAANGNALQIVSTASTMVQSGYGTATVTNPGNIVSNGGTISVTVSTGYAGTTGWHVSLLCPGPRTVANGGCQGGTTDGRFANLTAPNDCSACSVSWPVPSDASQNVSTAGWNTWEVELYNGLLAIGYAPVTVNILPPSSPTTPPGPGVTFANNGKFVDPTASSTLTVTVYANVSSQSGPILGITLWVYYLLPSQAPVNEPACGASWVTTGCPAGYALGAAQLRSNGANGLIGTYSFGVDPPAGTTQIGVLAESFARGEQGSPITSFLVQITPASCNTNPNSPGCRTQSGLSLWTTAAPILLTVALVLVAVLAALWLPMAYAAVVGVLAGAGVVAVWVGDLYLGWFHQLVAFALLR